jgi:hypothetical protein
VRDLAYDQQCEGSRADYLYQLLAGDPDLQFYRDTILSAARTTEDLHDLEQLLDFAVLFAREGDTEARDVIYERFRRSCHTSETMDLDGEYQIIELDGAEGLVTVLDGLVASSRGEDWVLESAVEEAEMATSISEVCSMLLQAREKYPNIAAALDVLKDVYSPDWSPERIVEEREAAANRRLSSRQEVHPGMTWREVKSSPDFERIIHDWPQSTSDEEFEACARDLDPNDEPKRLQRHLRAFRKRPFPLDPKPLIDLVDSASETTAIHALNALELVHHDDVRALFERLRYDQAWSHRAVGLLRHNYREGDEAIILEMLAGESDPDNLHVMCIDAMYVHEDNPLEPAAQTLLSIYDKTPCSVCRYKCLGHLQAIGAAPDWMLEECAFDAYADTREMVAGIKLIEE